MKNKTFIIAASSSHAYRFNSLLIHKVPPHTSNFPLYICRPITVSPLASSEKQKDYPVLPGTDYKNIVLPKNFLNAVCKEVDQLLTLGCHEYKKLKTYLIFLPLPEIFPGESIADPLYYYNRFRRHLCTPSCKIRGDWNEVPGEIRIFSPTLISYHNGRDWIKLPVDK